MAQTADPRLVGASSRFRVRARIALVVATGAAVVAVALDSSQRISGDGLAPLVPRLLAAAAIGIGGATAVVATLERRSRGTSRRATPWLLIAIALAVILLGQMVGYLVTAAMSGPFDVRAEALPLLLGAPIYCIGLLSLSWPPGMGRLDRWSVAADAVLAALALLPVWLVLVVPVTKRADSAAENVMVEIDPWVQYSAVVVVVVLASASRRSGALPIRQLILLQSATLLYLIVDIAGDVHASADRQSGISWSILGYLVAIMLFVAAAVRPELEADSAGTARRREWWSTVVPLIPLAVLVVVIVIRQGWQGSLPPNVRAASGVAMLALVVTTALARVAVNWQLRAARDAAVAVRLQEGAGADWFAALVGDARDVVTVVDHSGVILYQTPSVTAAFGYPLGGLVGRHLEGFAVPSDGTSMAQLLLRAAMDETDRGPHEVIVRDSSGLPRDTETTVSPLRLLGSDGFVLTTRDVTDRRLLLDQLSASQARDPLTGLSNRDGFLALLAQVLPAERPQTAVCLMDVHAFRNVNETHGHAIGDEVLRAAAGRLNRLPGAVVAVARLSGDEFAFAVRAAAPDAEVARLRRELREEFAVLNLPSGLVVPLDFALGYTIGRQETDPAGLVEEAGLALVSARSVGADGMAAFAPEMRAAVIARLRVERDLREALTQDRIVVHYQPIVSMADGSILGVEALVRMIDSDGAMVGPFVFVPVAESMGLIHELGTKVLAVALRDVQALSAALGRQLSVSVNVSALQLDHDLHPTVEDAMKASGVNPNQVTLELTETVLAENQDAAGQYLARLRELGCKVAMDDFGTGYSSLSYLASLPIDIIKVDRSFVMGLGEQESSMVLVRTVIQLARSLGLTTVAEGVETHNQERILRTLGADRGQGYLFSRPVSLTDLLALLESTGGVLSSAGPPSDADGTASTIPGPSRSRS